MNQNTYRLSTRIWFAVMLLLPFVVFGNKLLDMPKPTHTEAGVPCAKLTVVKKILPDFDEDLFFARPWLITVSKRNLDGHFYIYYFDYKLEKIFIFNDLFKYVRQFLDGGQGPAEVFPGFPGNINFYSAPDGLYVSAPMSIKIIQFSPTGEYIKDIKMPWNRTSGVQFPPVVDEDGNFYIYSTKNGIIDKYDKKMNLMHTYLDMKLNGRFVIYKPNYEKFYKNSPFRSDMWLLPNLTNSIYDLTSDGHLLVYLYRSSTVYLFKESKLIRQFGILIDRVLPICRKRAEVAFKYQKTRKTRGIRAALMFSYCFVDKDEPFFYLGFNDENRTATLYKFDLKGKLVEVIKNVDAAIKAKRHGLYFGLAAGDMNPVIFKKEELR
jgi:hypothetical protein